MTKAQTQQACQLLMMQVTNTEYATITYSAQDLNSPFKTSILMNFQSFIKVKILPKFSFFRGLSEI